MKRLSWENSAHLHTASAAWREELAGFKREKAAQQHHFSLHGVPFLQNSSSSSPLTVFLCLLEQEKEGFHFKRNYSVALMPNNTMAKLSLEFCRNETLGALPKTRPSNLLIIIIIMPDIINKFYEHWQQQLTENKTIKSKISANLRDGAWFSSNTLWGIGRSSFPHPLHSLESFFNVVFSERVFTGYVGLLPDTRIWPERLSGVCSCRDRLHLLKECVFT